MFNATKNLATKTFCSNLTFKLPVQTQTSLFVHDFIIIFKVSDIVTSNECIASNGWIPERSDTSEYIKG